MQEVSEKKWRSNEEMISWMKENDFFVRISIDGNKETHKKNRLQKDGNSAYATIMQNLKFIKKSGLKYTIRMTVANNTLDRSRRHWMTRMSTVMRDICIS